MIDHNIQIFFRYHADGPPLVLVRLVNDSWIASGNSDAWLSPDDAIGLLKHLGVGAITLEGFTHSDIQKNQLCWITKDGYLRGPKYRE